MRSNENPNYYIKYMVNIDNFNKYWCFDFSSIFKNYEFVLIEEINIPLHEYGTDIGRNLLQLFCDVMTIQNKVIAVSINDLQIWQYIYNADDYEELEMTFIDLIHDIGFVEFYNLNRDFDNCVYFYAGSKLGRMILHDLETYYIQNIS